MLYSIKPLEITSDMPPTTPNQYPPSLYERHKASEVPHIDSAAVVRALIRELRDGCPALQDFKGSRIRTKDEADWLLRNLNDEDGMHLQSLQALWHGGTRIQFTYVPSNLGEGYLFYFICESCSRRVKRLYMPQAHWRWLCRECHRLTY